MYLARSTDGQGSWITYLRKGIMDANCVLLRMTSFMQATESRAVDEAKT